MIRISTSKRPIFLVGVIQDLVYTYDWPSRLIRPIFKVKRAPKRAYPLFQRFSCAIANHFLGYPDSDVNNANFFCGRPSRPCIWIRFSLTASPTYFEGQTSPESGIPLISTIFMCYSKPFFGWSGLRRPKFQKFLWTSVNTLAMQPVGHHGQSDPFSRSNEPRSAHTPHLDDFRVL